MKHGYTSSSQSQKKLHDSKTSSFTNQKKKPSKKMMAMFCDSEGLLQCEFLPPKTTKNSNEYCETLEIFCEGIKEKVAGWLTTGVRLLHNAV
jgi:hypothetical protein